MAENIMPRQYAPPGRGVGESKGFALGHGRFLPSDVLRWAMAYLDAHGWCQGGIANSSGEVCGQGSVLGAAKVEMAKLPHTVMTRKETPFDFSALSKMMFEGRDEPIAIGAPEYSFELNPEILHLENAAHEASQMLMNVAIKAGWKSEGCAQGSEYHDVMLLTGGFGKGHTCSPYKDPFAVFNDDPGTSIEDVAMMMKEAISALEAEGR